jgi:two-component system sensor histidine kinase PilS (NtrC family)
MARLNVQMEQLNDANAWRSLTVFAGYRLFLAAGLVLVFYLQLPPRFLGDFAPQLYNIVSQCYLIIAIVLLLLTRRQWASFESQTKVQLVIDVVMITLLIHASGGLKTSLGSLLVVVVVAGGVLIPGRSASFIAAIATLSILIEAVCSQLFKTGLTEYSDAGVLGATFFATAILTQILSKKMASSQQLADDRAADIVNLAMLNEHIISRMETGVLVISSEGKIQLSNQSAQHLLGMQSMGIGKMLKQRVPLLGEQLRQWKQNRSQPFTSFQAMPDLPEVAVNAIALDSGETVLYIENTSAVSQQAQQLKLASLGQLTASIAHEVRNPLGAISHAGELLAEVNNGNAETKKLTDIIQRHSARVNNIIQTILEMSRRKTVEPSVIVLAAWLEHLIVEVTEYKHLMKGDIALTINAPLAKVYLDAEQLRQVLWNILDNAWHYSQSPGSDLAKRVEVILSIEDNEALLDIVDNGPGVSDNMLTTLFEPFQSERQGGTGLGLYLARELCQANGVRLNYVFDKVGQSCFRLHLPMKKQENLK